MSLKAAIRGLSSAHPATAMDGVVVAMQEQLPVRHLWRLQGERVVKVSRFERHGFYPALNALAVRRTIS